jgi:DNA-binding response OmpR family regulator
MTFENIPLTHHDIRDRITPPGALDSSLPQHETSHVTPRRVLVVEDDSSYRSLLTLILTQRGYEVREAEDGVEGLNIAQTSPVDMVLVDFDLPLLHGLEVVRRLRQQQKFQSLPVVMMTSHGRRVRDNAINAGCNEFLTKPIDFKELDGLLDKFAPATS